MKPEGEDADETDTLVHKKRKLLVVYIKFGEKLTTTDHDGGDDDDPLICVSGFFYLGLL